MASSAYLQFGPYALFDRSTNQPRAMRLDAEAVERELFRRDGTGAR